MKILFALDPWIYRDTAGEQLYTASNIFAPAINSLLGFGHDVRLLIGDDMTEHLSSRKINVACAVAVVPLQKLYDIYPNHYSAHLTQHEGRDSNEQISSFRNLVRCALGDWCPQVTIVFSTPVAVWQKCLPDTLALQFENGLFSRAPYPHLCQLDPFGFLSRSYPYLFRMNLRRTNPGSTAVERLRRLMCYYEEKFSVTTTHSTTPVWSIIQVKRHC